MDKNSSGEGMRIHWIDNLRGFAFINMVAYHLMFDLVWIFGFDIGWYKGSTGYAWQQAICITLIFISGISCAFGSHNIRRGVTILFCGMLMTAGTWLFMPDELIVFGVLHFLGCARIIFGLLKKLLIRINETAGFIIFILLFAVTKTVPDGALGLWDKALFRLPRALYGTKLLFSAGLPHPSFSSADYFPLIPWIFLYFSGYFFWRILKKTGLEGRRLPSVAPLAWVGRNSLLIYVLHQPVIYGILLLLNRLGIF